MSEWSEIKAGATRYAERWFEAGGLTVRVVVEEFRDIGWSWAVGAGGLYHRSGRLIADLLPFEDAKAAADGWVARFAEALLEGVGRMPRETGVERFKVAQRGEP